MTRSDELRVGNPAAFMMSSSLVNPPHLAPAGPFSHAVVIPPGHATVFTAGQVGTVDAQGTIAESYEGQVEAAIKNLGSVLAASGAEAKDIVKLTYYIVGYDTSIRSVHIGALQRFLNGHKPATSLIGVKSLATNQIKFEIEAIAAVRPGAIPYQDISARLA